MNEDNKAVRTNKQTEEDRADKNLEAPVHPQDNLVGSDEVPNVNVGDGTDGTPVDVLETPEGDVIDQETPEENK
jgi:hypothetical protein